MIRLALAQINPIVGDFKGNLNKINIFINQALKDKCDLVIFPELSLCGYPAEDLLLKKSFIQANQKYLKQLVKNVKDITVICGFEDSKNGKRYNSAAVINNKKLKLNYHKNALPNYGVFDEKRYFEAGKTVPILSVKDSLIGLNLCEDIWISPCITEYQAELGASIVINISASPYHRHKLDERIKLLRKRARANNIYVVYTNLVGGQDELVFDGGSLVIDPKGKVIARAKQFQEDLLIVDIPHRKLKRDTRYSISEKRGQLKQLGLSVESVELKQISDKSRSRKKNRISKKLPDLEEIYQALVMGTADYIYKNGFKKVIIGLSGGIDSALTAAVAVDALGKKNVLTLFMPTRYTTDTSFKASTKQAKLLDIKMHLIEIDPLFESYNQQLKPYFKGKTEDITEENIQARIRGNLLMAFSNKFNYLVLNTGNKSEAAVGYSTLYGDMVGGFAPLKDIPKTLVFKLSRYLNRSRKQQVINPVIINRPPSAELKANQIDSDTLPPYKLLDQILQKFVEQDQSIDDIVKQGFDRKTVKKVVWLILAAEYKRRQLCPGIKITPRAFGKDRRWPITNKF